MVALHENVCLALSLSAVDASAFADKLAPTLKAIATDGTTIVNRTSMASTISYMNGNPAPRVIIADHGIFFKTNLDLALKLSEFVRDGGHLVVLAGTSEHLKRELDAFVKERFGLAWRYGAYHRASFKLNPEFTLLGDAKLPATLTHKALTLTAVPSSDAVYLSDAGEAAAACKMIGSGWFAFVGDMEKATGSLQSALLRFE